MTSLDNVANFVQVQPTTGYDAAATEIVLQPSQGAKLPAAPFNLIWWNVTDYPNPANDPNVEIVRVTDVTSDTITVLRAQEGTSATQKRSSGKIYNLILGITAKMIADIQAALGATVGLKFIQVTGAVPGTAFTAASAITGKSVIIQNNTFFFQDVDYTVSGLNITWAYTLTADFTSPLTLICVG